MKSTPTKDTMVSCHGMDDQEGKVRNSRPVKSASMEGREVSCEGMIVRGRSETHSL